LQRTLPRLCYPSWCVDLPSCQEEYNLTPPSTLHHHPKHGMGEATGLAKNTTLLPLPPSLPPLSSGRMRDELRNCFDTLPCSPSTSDVTPSWAGIVRDGSHANGIRDKPYASLHPLPPGDLQQSRLYHPVRTLHGQGSSILCHCQFFCWLSRNKCVLLPPSAIYSSCYLGQ
jgi:hypothetical protein